MPIRFEDLTEDLPLSCYHPLDRPLEDLSGHPIHVREFYEGGVTVKGGLLPDDLVDAYCRVREPLGPKGWAAGCSYMQVEEMLDLCCNPALVSFLADLFGGDEVGLHLCLTDWVSTERNWHQDIYLSSKSVGSYYVAVWMALDDIDPDAGPFEYAAGSHVLPPISMEKTRAALQSPRESNSPEWPKHSERFLTEACNDVIGRYGFPVRQFLGKKGEVLAWHSRLIHRGSVPRIPGSERRSLIAHYSVVSRRSKIDMPNYQKSDQGGTYFVF